MTNITNDLPEIRAWVFDAYGTLFDLASAVARFRPRLGPHADQVAELWRTKQLEYTWLRTLSDQYTDFSTVTAEALAYAFEYVQLEDMALQREMLAAYRTLSPYPDVRTVLHALRERGHQTAILSNGAPEALEAAVANAGLNDVLDAVLSADAVRVFKPHPKVYQMAVTTLGVPKEAISFQTANAWDAAGAATFGFRTVWINRRAWPAEKLPGVPHRQVASLHELLG